MSARVSGCASVLRDLDLCSSLQVSMIMHHIIAVPLLLLGGVLQAEALHTGAKIVNLTEEARKYIGKVNRTALGKIDSWGLTKEYHYWTQNHRIGHPIRVNVSKLSCVPSNHVDVPQKMRYDSNCKNEVSLYITEGMLSPFNLSTQVTFPLTVNNKAHRTTIVTVDLNGKKEDHITIEKKPGKSEIRGCDFFAEVSFDGYFAYRSKKYDGYYYKVPVKYLKNYDVKLYARRGKLVYNITGSYVEKICY